jgi:RNA polymerase sigma factor (sigma-70 family)
MKSPDPVKLSKFYESGAQEDFEAFVLDAESWIFKKARNLIRGPIAGKFELAEDVTWMVLRKVEGSRCSKPWISEKGSLAGWLYRMIRNLVSSYLRVKVNRFLPCSDFRYEYENGKTDSPEQRLVDHRSASPEDLLLKAERLTEALGLVNQLPAVTQRVLALYFGEGLTYREIANELGSNPSTVYRQVSLARTKLSDLGQHEEVAA